MTEATEKFFSAAANGRPRQLAPKSVNLRDSMIPKSNVSTLLSILSQLCPRCRSGKIFRASIFRGLPKMNEFCLVCGLKFEREEGYFLGAMYISYGVALAIIAAFAALFWAFTGWTLGENVIGAIVCFVPLAPMVSRFSRIVWIYFDRAIDPE